MGEWHSGDGPQSAPSRCHIPWRAHPCELCELPKAQGVAKANACAQNWLESFEEAGKPDNGLS